MTPAVNTGMVKVLNRDGFLVTQEVPFGPAGFKLVVKRQQLLGSIIVTQAEFEAQEWLHASLAFPNHMPSYEMMQTLHRAVFGRQGWSYEVFAPADRHVNIHENARHLWGRTDRKPGLPDFVGDLGSV